MKLSGVNRKVLLSGLCVLMHGTAWAHHGVASLGAAGLHGPGAPVESSASATLPQGKSLLYLKLDHAAYKRFDNNPANPESRYADFWMAGVGYGFKSWLSAYLFLPYHIKQDEAGGHSTEGWADISWMVQLGFKYDDGLRLTPGHESLDDMEDWHFTAYVGSTLPTGNPNLRDQNGAIDPGKSTGFGKPAISVGLTATKQLSDRLTINQEVSYIYFDPYRYADGQVYRFGNEFRYGASSIYRLWLNSAQRMRLDGVLEAQYLALERDEQNGAGLEATGGRIAYITPGVRFYWKRASIAAGIKWPVWTDLNESGQQQGAEGKEDWRLLLSMSYLY
jgi:hypothetical protein